MKRRIRYFCEWCCNNPVKFSLTIYRWPKLTNLQIFICITQFYQPDVSVFSELFRNIGIVIFMQRAACAAPKRWPSTIIVLWASILVAADRPTLKRSGKTDKLNTLALPIHSNVLGLLDRSFMTLRFCANAKVSAPPVKAISRLQFRVNVQSACICSVLVWVMFHCTSVTPGSDVW